MKKEELEKVGMKEEKKSKRVLIKVGVAALVLATAGLGIATVKMQRNHEAFKSQAALEKDELVKKYDLSYQTIENNLFEITAHEDILRANFNGNGEPIGPMTSEERIIRETQIIKSLIAENEALISKLQTKLGEQDQAVLDVEKRNRRLKRKLNTFQTQIADLELVNKALMDSLATKTLENEKLFCDLNLMKVENDSLNADLLRQNEVYTAQQTVQTDLQKKMNTSYYVVGNYKKLAELDVVEKEGGILGLGATKELKEDFDREQFTPIDRLNFTMIPVFAKKAELATTHPSTSYQWIKNEEGVQWLEIKKPEQFWEQSKYLVVLTDKKTQLAAVDDL